MRSYIKNENNLKKLNIIFSYSLFLILYCIIGSYYYENGANYEGGWVNDSREGEGKINFTWFCFMKVIRIEKNLLWYIFLLL